MITGHHDAPRLPAYVAPVPVTAEVVRGRGGGRGAARVSCRQPAFSLRRRRAIVQSDRNRRSEKADWIILQRRLRDQDVRVRLGAARVTPQLVRSR